MFSTDPRARLCVRISCCEICQKHGMWYIAWSMQRAKQQAVQHGQGAWAGHLPGVYREGRGLHVCTCQAAALYQTTSTYMLTCMQAILHNYPMCFLGSPPGRPPAGPPGQRS